MKLFFSLTILILILIPILPAQAVELIPPCAKAGNGGICCILKVISNFAQVILGLVGAVALLFFIVGGFMWITSAGSSEKVKKGQSLMTNTIIGIIIVVLAWFIVNFIILSIAGTPNVVKNLFSTNTAWYEICKENSN